MIKKELKLYKVSELCDGFVYDKSEGKGLNGLGGMLTIQPEYQRNYIYYEQNREVPVIQSVLANKPLGLIYFNKTGEDTYEVLDGQQRITSLGRFLTGLFTIRDATGREHDFNGLDKDLQQKINDTELLVYIIDAESEQEIKDLFETINRQGIMLNEQEKSNAAHCGPFVTACKHIWSNKQNSEVMKWSNYIAGNASRQDYLHAALDWVSNGNIDSYMSRHRRDSDITEIKNYFDSVISWVSTMFIELHDVMKHVDWGRLYREYHTKQFNIKKINKRIEELMDDDCVQDKKSVYEFVLRSESGDVDYRLLNVRFFSPAVAKRVYDKQTAEAMKKGKSNCPLCALSSNPQERTKVYKLKEMEADHVTPWSKGGDTGEDNCQMLCKTHNRSKGNR